MAKKIFNHIFFCIVFLNVNNLNAQNSNIDSLKESLLHLSNIDTSYINVLNSLAKQFYDIDINQTKKYADESLTLSKKLNFKKGEAESKRLIGIYYHKTGQYDSAMSCYQESLIISKNINNSEGIASALNNIALIYYYLGSYSNALKYYYQSYDIRKESGDKEKLTVPLNNIALIYTELKDYDKALFIYKLCLKQHQSSGHDQEKALTYMNMAHVYQINDSLNLAEKYYQKSIEICKSHGIKLTLIYNFMRLAAVYDKKGNFYSAKKLHYDAIKLAKNINAIYETGEAYSRIANHYYLQDSLKSAIAYADSSLNIAIKINNLSLISDATEILYKSHEKTQNTKSALLNYKLYKQANDSLFNKSVQRMQKRFELEKISQIQEQINRHEIRNQKFIKNLFILGFLTILVFFFFLFFGYIKKKKTNRILSLQKEELNFFISKLQESNKNIERQNQILNNLSGVVQSSDNSVMIINPDGYIEWVNNGFTKLYGFTLEEFVSKGRNIFDSTTNKESVKHIKEAIRKKSSITYEIELIDKEGKTIWVQTTWTPILDADGNITKIIGIDSDIRNLKDAWNRINQQNKLLTKYKNELETLVSERTEKLNEALVKATESDRLKTSFLNNISHEIRTPLNAIVGFSDLIVNRNSDKEKCRDLIAENVRDLLYIIDSIIELSNLYVSKTQLDIRPFQLKSFFSEVKEISGEKRKHKKKENIELIFDYNPDNLPGIINSDKEKLKKILVNLIDNALKYTESGYIKLNSYKEKDHIFICIEDSGIGIPEDKLEDVYKVFHKFQSPENIARGLGIGLALVQQLSFMLEIDIEVNSILGKGTKFILKLNRF